MHHKINVEIKKHSSSVVANLLIYWNFHVQPSLEFTENGPKKRKYLVSGSCVDENTLLMLEENGQTG